MSVRRDRSENITRCLIAPVIVTAGDGVVVASRQNEMSYACQNCAKRKVKCDKMTPRCSSCHKSRLDCVYQPPLARRRKRTLSVNVDDRLARYERISTQHGFITSGGSSSSSLQTTSRDLLPSNDESSETLTPRTGKLLAGQGRSRYIDSNYWRNLGDDATHPFSDDVADDVSNNIDANLARDPLTNALFGCQRSLLQSHPTHAHAKTLWKIYVGSVEPICRILHIPSVTRTVLAIAQRPSTASKADECLLFAIYHFAIYSTTEEECGKNFGQSRATLMESYRSATQQALVNTSFLKTTEMSVLQAFVLFLIPCRHYYDAHTFWILTGVAMRIAQRMGLHQDGEKLGLPPFDVQMRRRLFYQLLPLEGIASEMSGVAVVAVPENWNLQPPLNINDNQIWPGMTEQPQEQKGASEMIFCLARSSVGKASMIVAKAMRSSQDYCNVESIIRQAEVEVEEKYIRYCDVVNPLHFLTICSARSAITAMQLRIRLPRVKDASATDLEKRELFQLAQKILDTDAAACANTGLRIYCWHTRSFFVWGTWDSLIYMVTTLKESHLFLSAEVDVAWSKLERLYSNHTELLEVKQALYAAVGRATLAAWVANPPSTKEPEPAFISNLRLSRGPGSKRSSASLADDPTNHETMSIELTKNVATPADSMDPFFTKFCGSLNTEIDFDTVDWTLWDQLIHEHQVQGG